MAVETGTTESPEEDAASPTEIASGLHASYYRLTESTSWLSDIDFDRIPDATGIVDRLDRDASNDPFWEGGPVDSFAARFSGSLLVDSPGTYTLFLTSDDGSALYLDGRMVIDNDGAHAATRRQVTLDLEAGTHDLDVRYFERGGVQNLQLEWQGPDTAGMPQILKGASLAHDPAAAVATVPGEPGLAAEYFRLPNGVARLSEIDFGRTPDATGAVAALDIMKSKAAFWDGGPTDNFAARYTGSLVVETAGTYTLYLTSDDGSALYLDGEMLIDNDGLHATRTQQVTLDLAAGEHALEVLYFERGGVQTLELDWQGPDTDGLRQTVDFTTVADDASGGGSGGDAPTADPGPWGLDAEFLRLPASVSRLSEIDFARTPDASGTVAALDMSASDAPFWDGGPTDNFAARYTGSLVVETAGTYTLYLTSDDGSALYLDGEMLIDNDGLHATRTQQVTLDLAAGEHALEVLYFERGGVQTLELDWQGPDTDGIRQTIDGAALVPESAPPIDDGPGTASARLEAGTLTVEQAGPDQWHSVTFSSPIENARVVMGPVSLNGADPVVVRVRDVTDTGFEFQFDEWDYLDGTHGAETVSWIAGTEGTHVLSSGQTVGFGRTTLQDDNPAAVSLSGFAKTPAVFAQVTSANDPAAVTQRTQSVTADGFTLRLQEEEAADQRHAAETVDWLAIDYGAAGALDAGLAAASDAATTVSFDPPTGSPAIFAAQQTFDGRDTASMRLRDLGPDSATFAIEEEQSADSETGHVSEQVAYLSLADGTVLDLTAPEPPALPSLSFDFTTDGPAGTGTWSDADGSGDLTPGDTLTYSYTIVNDGAVALTNLALADTAAPGLSASDLSGLSDTDGDGLADDLAVGATATASVSYRVADADAGTSLTASATVTTAQTGTQSASISQDVAAPTLSNVAPSAAGDAFFTGHDTSLELDAADLLANDRDADGDALTLTEVRTPSGGHLTVTGETILFTPTPGFHGTATFDYSVSDGTASSTATVSVRVAPPGYAGALLAALPDGTGLADPSLAVGLDGFRYWKSPPFLNLMKQGGLPGIRDSSGDQVALENLVKDGYLDSNGYPVKMYPGNDALPLWQQGYDITVSIHHENDFVRQETSGDYVVEWAGAGDISLRDFDVTSRETVLAADGTVAGGRMTGRWGYEDVLKTVKILDTDPDGTGNYIRDISIVRAEYKDMYDAGALFDPRYTALIEDHHTLRFMDWMGTNGSDVKSVADVASPDSLTWAGTVDVVNEPEVSATGLLPLPAQIPFEAMVQLANEVGADPWFNIPLKADDGYVRALAEYVEAHLDDGLVAKFELSNEVWNWAGGFEQVREASLLGSDGATSTNIGAARDHYGYRSAEIRAILDAEMSRVEAEMILGTQTVYFAIAEMVEDGVNRYFADRGISGQMSDVFDSLAVTGYFSEVNRDEFADLRQFWYATSEADFAAGRTASKHEVFVARAADYLANGISALTPEERALVATEADGSIRADLTDPLEGKLRSNFAENKRMADAWGLDLIQYEADSHISPKNYRGDPESEWYKALNKSPEMGALTARMAEIFREEGGTLVNDFGHLSDSDYGLWGTRAHMADENPISAAYDAYNASAAAEFGSINTGREPSAFLHGVTETGTDGADELTGTAQRDYLIGGDGNDLLVGGSSDDGLHGGSGVDMALFAGRLDEFDFRVEGDVLVAGGPTDEDRLVDVELLAFAGSGDFVRVSDLTGEAPVADLSDLLTQFDAEHGILTSFF